MTEKVKQQDMKVIVFELMDKEYAIKVDVVQSIERLISITRIPNTPSYVRGVINLRGIVTPIVDLRERFGIDLKEVDNQTRIIIVSLEEYDVGLIVDAANDVLDIPVELIESQPEVVGTVESEFISGVAKIDKRLLVMLDLERVLEPVKQVAMDEHLRLPITDMHLDVFKEIGNIGAGHAATSLSQLLDRKIDMHVPRWISYHSMVCLTLQGVRMKLLLASISGLKVIFLEACFLYYRLKVQTVLFKS